MVIIKYIQNNEKLAFIYFFDQELNIDYLNKNFSEEDKIIFWSCKKKLSRPFYIDEMLFNTLQINLNMSLDEIYGSFNKTYKYEIRRAEKKDKIKYLVKDRLSEKDFKYYVKFYNEFAKSKNRPPCEENKIWQLNCIGSLLVTYAFTEDNELLCVHSYVLDGYDRACLVHTFSLFRYYDNDTKNMIGRANKFLHYKDIIYFKNLGFNIYDFGGYRLNPPNQEFINVNNFKRGFVCGRGEEEKIVNQYYHLVVDYSYFKFIKTNVNEFIENYYIYNKSQKIIIYGYSLTGKLVEDILINKNINITHILDKNIKITRNGKKVFDIKFLENLDPKYYVILVCTSAFEDIENTLKRLGFNENIINIKIAK